MSTDLTSETLSALAGLALSLAASYLPGFAPWYRAQDGEHKRLLMLGLLAAIAAGAYLFSAWQGRPADAQTLAAAFLSALAANQATFLMTPVRHA